ncbi:MAG: hypothetical protein IJ792_05630 [Oscillospiraceae bacterium]|nr:hypothetical protein [Oscillospiraceae bacterium]
MTMEETQERIEEQTREQAPKTRQVRRRRWSDLELGMFALAVLLAFL